VVHLDHVENHCSTASVDHLSDVVKENGESSIKFCFCVTDKCGKKS